MDEDEDAMVEGPSRNDLDDFFCWAVGLTEDEADLPCIDSSGEGSKVRVKNSLPVGIELLVGVLLMSGKVPLLGVGAFLPSFV
jgi:hypothetical protein